MRYVFGDYCLDTQRYELHNALMPLDEQARILDHLDAAEALAERLARVEHGQGRGDNREPNDPGETVI